VTAEAPDAARSGSASEGADPVRFRRFEPGDAAAIARLNDRLARGGSAHRVYPEDEAHRDTGEDGTTGVRERLFVLAQGQEVRAGCFLREQPFAIGGDVVSAGWTKYPVAESLVDRAHAGVPGSLLFGLLRVQPRLMALGMGGHDNPWAKLLAAMRFTGSSIPFYVMPSRPSRVLRELPQLQRTPWRRAAAQLLGRTGIGWAALSTLAAARRLRGPRRPTGYVAHVEPVFGAWADAVWDRASASYGALAVRSARVLGRLYDGDAFRGVSRLRVERDGDTVGWAVTHRMDFRAREDSPFGRLAVGVVADAMARPADAAGVTLAATRHLLDEGVDFLISNQAHPAWGAALVSAGFLETASTFAFYRSPAMEKRLAASGALAGGLHLGRGDGDGLMRV
jgi:hypothetical protein